MLNSSAVMSFSEISNGSGSRIPLACGYILGLLFLTELPSPLLLMFLYPAVMVVMISFLPNASPRPAKVSCDGTPQPISLRTTCLTKKNLNGESLPIPRGAGHVLKARDSSGHRSRSFHILFTNHARECIWSAKPPRFEALSRLPGFYSGSAYGAVCVGMLGWIVQIIQALPFS